MGYINFYFRFLTFLLIYWDRNPKEKLVNIPVPKFVLTVTFFIYDIVTYGNSKEHYRNDFYGFTKKRFLFFLTNLLTTSFTYETIQLENK